MSMTDYNGHEQECSEKKSTQGRASLPAHFHLSQACHLNKSISCLRKKKKQKKNGKAHKHFFKIFSLRGLNNQRILRYAHKASPVHTLKASQGLSNLWIHRKSFFLIPETQ